MSERVMTEVELADVARHWPEPVQAALRVGALDVLARTDPTVIDHLLEPDSRRADVLDLGRPDARDLVRAVADDLRKPPHLRTGVAASAPRYPVIVSWGGCAALPDLVGALGAVRAMLAPGGWFVFAEPIGRPGVGRVLQASVEARRADLRELHLARDLNAALREAGFVVDSVHRTRVPGVALLVRYLAYGRACVIGDGTETGADQHADAETDTHAGAASETDTHAGPRPPLTPPGGESL